MRSAKNKKFKIYTGKSKPLLTGLPQKSVSETRRRDGVSDTLACFIAFFTCRTDEPAPASCPLTFISLVMLPQFVFLQFHGRYTLSFSDTEGLRRAQRATLRRVFSISAAISWHDFSTSASLNSFGRMSGPDPLWRNPIERGKAYPVGIDVAAVGGF